MTDFIIAEGVLPENEVNDPNWGVIQETTLSKRQLCIYVARLTDKGIPVRKK